MLIEPVDGCDVSLEVKPSVDLDLPSCGRSEAPPPGALSLEGWMCDNDLPCTNLGPLFFARVTLDDDEYDPRLGGILGRPRGAAFEERSEDSSSGAIDMSKRSRAFVSGLLAEVWSYECEKGNCEV